MECKDLSCASHFSRREFTNFPANMLSMSVEITEFQSLAYCYAWDRQHVTDALLRKLRNIDALQPRERDALLAEATACLTKPQWGLVDKQVLCSGCQHAKNHLLLACTNTWHHSDMVFTLVSFRHICSCMRLDANSIHHRNWSLPWLSADGTAAAGPSSRQPGDSIWRMGASARLQREPLHLADQLTQGTRARHYRKDGSGAGSQG